MAYIPPEEFGDPTRSQLIGPPVPRPEPTEPEGPSWFESAAAAFRQENSLVSAVDLLLDKTRHEPVDGYNPVDDPQVDEFRTQGLDDFIYSESPSETAYIIRRKKRKADDDKTLAASGPAGVVFGLAAGILSPEILLPGGVLVGGVSRGTRALGTAASVGVASGVATAVQEGILQATQYDRPLSDSAINVAGSVVIGGVLGGAIGGLTGRQVRELGQQIEREVADEADTVTTLQRPSVFDDDDVPSSAAPAGAAVVGPERGSSLPADRFTRGVSDVFGSVRMSPVNVLQGSELETARTLVRDFAEAILPVEANRQGVVSTVGGSVETRIKAREGVMVQLFTEWDRLFSEYRFNQPEPNMVQRTIQPIVSEVQAVADRAAGRAARLTAREFREEVARASRRNDQHADARIAAAAAAFRRYADGLKKEAVELGLLDKNVRVLGAESWLHRLYNRQQIINERGVFKDRLVNWFSTQQQRRMFGKQTLAKMLDDEFASGAAGPEAKAAAQAYRFLKDSKPVKPRSLRDFVRDIGGLLDEGGEVSAMVGGRNRGVGYINNTGGKSIDDAAEAAFEAGYISRHDMNEFLDALREDIRGNRIFSRADDADVALFTSREEARAVLDNYGATLRNREDDIRARVAREIGPSPEDYGVTGLEDFFGESTTLSKMMTDPDSFADMTRDEISSMVDEVIDSITGVNTMRNPTLDIVQGPRGALKARTLNVPDRLIEDFLENDIEKVTRIFTRSMGADIELTRKFGKVDLEDQTQAVRDEATRRMNAATTPAERRKIDGERDRAIRNIEALRDRVRGVYGLPENPDGLASRLGESIMALNYMRLLGGMTLSALPDMTFPVMKFGLGRVFRDGWTPFLRSMTTGDEVTTLLKSQVEIMRPGLELALDQRALELAGLFNETSGRTLAERAIQEGSSRFGLVSLMAPWNEAMKQMAGVTSVGDLMDGIQALAKGTANARTIERMAAANIDAGMAKEMWALIQNGGGQQIKGRWWPNTNTWATIDPKRGQILSRTLATAVIRDVDSVIVTPGLERNLWMAKPLGKLIMQFKSFAFSANQRILLAGLAKRDAEVLSGVVLAMGMGAVAAHLKQIARGESTADWENEKWLVEAFDHSGVSGVFMEVNNVAEKMTRGAVGLSAVTGEVASRYQSRNALGALLGPTFDAVQDAMMVTGAVSQGEFSRSDIRRIRKMVPLQNLFYIRQLLDQVEENVGDAMGLPDLPGR